MFRVRQGKVSEGGSHYGSVLTQQCSTVTWSGDWRGKHDDCTGIFAQGRSAIISIELAKEVQAIILLYACLVSCLNFSVAPDLGHELLSYVLQTNCSRIGVLVEEVVCVQRDLAARNILLSDDHTCKVKKEFHTVRENWML